MVNVGKYTIHWVPGMTVLSMSFQTNFKQIAAAICQTRRYCSERMNECEENKNHKAVWSLWPYFCCVVNTSNGIVQNVGVVNHGIPNCWALYIGNKTRHYRDRRLMPPRVLGKCSISGFPKIAGGRCQHESSSRVGLLLGYQKHLVECQSNLQMKLNSNHADLFIKHIACYNQLVLPYDIPSNWLRKQKYCCPYQNPKPAASIYIHLYYKISSVLHCSKASSNSSKHLPLEVHEDLHGVPPPKKKKTEPKDSFRHKNVCFLSFQLPVFLTYTSFS